MLKNALIVSRTPNLAARASALAMIVALASMGGEPAMAQDNGSGSDRPYLDSPTPSAAPRATKPRRNDAYRSTEPGSSLGVLTSPTSEPDRQVAQASPSGGYSPQYGAPTRPYGSYDEVPLQPVPAPNSYPPLPRQGQANDAYRPSGSGYAQPGPDAYPPASGGQYESRPPYREGPVVANQGGYGAPYSAPPDYGPDRDRAYNDRDRDYGRDDRRDGTFSSRDIISTGNHFFGSMSEGLANIVESAFKRQGRPNGYILGEEGGGAFVAGLRYGEGTLYTRDAGTHRVYWQGPSLGYDFGGAGSKVMMLVYNLSDPRDIYERFGGVDGSAYLVGGLGMTVLTRDHVTVAPIRTGVGLRLGANVGYLKFTRRPTWNPF